MSIIVSVSKLNFSLTSQNLSLLEEVLQAVAIKDHQNAWKALILLEELHYQLRDTTQPATPDEASLPQVEA